MYSPFYFLSLGVFTLGLIRGLRVCLHIFWHILTLQTNWTETRVVQFECKMPTEQNAPDSLYFHACIVLINSGLYKLLYWLHIWNITLTKSAAALHFKLNQIKSLQLILYWPSWAAHVLVKNDRPPPPPLPPPIVMIHIHFSSIDLKMTFPT